MHRLININSIEEYFITCKKGEIYYSVIKKLEKTLIEKALEQSAGNQVIASRILGVNRNTLHSKIKRLNIDIKRFKTYGR